MELSPLCGDHQARRSPDWVAPGAKPWNWGEWVWERPPQGQPHSLLLGFSPPLWTLPSIPPGSAPNRFCPLESKFAQRALEPQGASVYLGTPHPHPLQDFSNFPT